MKSLLFLLSISTPLLGCSQNGGFFGKKNIISFSATGAIPIFNMFALIAPHDQTLYRKNGNGLSEVNNLFDGGFKASFVHSFSKSFGLGLEYGMYNSNCAGPSFVEMKYIYSSYAVQNVPLKHEMLDLTTMTIMPKIEFAANSSHLAVGLYNEFGIGYSNTKVKEKEYFSIYKSNSESYEDFDPRKVFDQKNRYHSLTIMYGISTRIPISKSFMFQAGIRYSLNLNANFLIKELIPEQSLTDKGYHTSKYVVGGNIARHRALSLVTGNIGFAFLF